jgi:hypothetical protein
MTNQERNDRPRRDFLSFFMQKNPSVTYPAKKLALGQRRGRYCRRFRIFCIEKWRIYVVKSTRKSERGIIRKSHRQERKK